MKQKGKHILSAICLCTLMPVSGNLMSQSNTSDQSIQIGAQKWATTNLNVISSEGEIDPSMSKVNRKAEKFHDKLLERPMK